MQTTEDANLAEWRGPANPRFLRVSLPSDPPESGAWPDEASEVLDPALAAAARSALRDLPGYAPTPLVSLPGLASRLGVSEVRCKDESERFGIGSFKALGGAYAVLRTLQDAIESATGDRPSPAALRAGVEPGAGRITAITASAGNHGRSVAWGSELFGCGCVVVLPEGTDAARAAAIESHGATVEWFAGDYDAAVAHAERRARERGWVVVSDTGYAGYEDIPRRVSEGYTLLAEEALSQLDDEAADAPTHLFIQTGVGGLAAGVCGHLWQRLAAARPRFVAVEPLSADCFGRSIRAGRFETVAGPFGTEMGGLAAGVPSTVAWRLLGRCLDGAVAIHDRATAAAAAVLDSGAAGARIAAGPSGAAGVAALLELTRLPGAVRMLGLGPGSRVLTLVTETRFRESTVVRPGAEVV